MTEIAEVETGGVVDRLSQNSWLAINPALKDY
jgi:hypothetical protein